MNFRYRLIFLFIFLALYSYSFSQPHIEWQKCLGGSGEDEARSKQQTGVILLQDTHSQKMMTYLGIME
jgi:hypothetical protein